MGRELPPLGRAVLFTTLSLLWPEPCPVPRRHGAHRIGQCLLGLCFRAHFGLYGIGFRYGGADSLLSRGAKRYLLQHVIHTRRLMFFLLFRLLAFPWSRPKSRSVSS